MKKASVMSTISMVFFILAFLVHIIGEIVYYIAIFAEGFFSDPFFWRYEAIYELPVILGMLLLIVGVKLAAKNKAWVIYPIGFLVLMVPFAANVFTSTAEYVIRGVLMLIALLLLALDHFIRPHVKVMGILGAVFALLTMTVFLVIDVVQTLQYIDSYSNGTEFLWLAERILYYIGFQVLSIAALLFAIGRPSRSDFAVPAPQPVYPGNGYQPPQYNPPQMPPQPTQYQYQPPQQPTQYQYQPPQQPPQDGRPY